MAHLEHVILLVAILQVLACDSHFECRYSMQNPKTKTQLRFLTQRAARINDLPGIRIAVTLSTKSETLSCAVVCINPCSEKRVPPAKKHMPSTRSRFERIEPTTARRNQNSDNQTRTNQTTETYKNSARREACIA